MSRARPARFVLRVETHRTQLASATERRSELDAHIARSRAQRAGIAVESARVDAELSSMMRALEEVEALGPRLNRLPHERLLQIQQVLQGGVRGPSGDGFLLPPVRPFSGRVPSASSRGAPGHARPAQPVRPPDAPRGLTESELRRLCVHAHVRAASAPDETSDDVCVICLSSMRRGDAVATLACAHSFHEACVRLWLQRDVHCPLCKAHALGDATPLPSPTASPRPPSPAEHASHTRRTHAAMAARAVAAANPPRTPLATPSRTSASAARPRARQPAARVGPAAALTVLPRGGGARASAARTGVRQQPATAGRRAAPQPQIGVYPR